MVALALAVVAVLALGACATSAGDATEPPVSAEGKSRMSEQSAGQLTATVNGIDFTVALEDNAAAEELLALGQGGPVTVSLRDYGGFEKVGDLPSALPASDERTTTAPGDLVLYQGDQLVCFYGSNTWSYTRLGRVDDVEGFVAALGEGDVTLTLSLD